MATKYIFELKMTGNLSGQYVANIGTYCVEGGSAADELLQMGSLGPEWDFDEVLTLLTGLAQDTTSGFLDLWTKMLPATYVLNTMQLKPLGFWPEDSDPIYKPGNTAIVIGDTIEKREGARGSESSVLVSMDDSPGISFLTSVAKRMNRIFLPGILSTDAENGLLSSGLIGDINAFGNAMLTGVTVNTGEYTWKKILSRIVGEPSTLECLLVIGFRLGFKMWNQRKRNVPL